MADYSPFILLFSLNLLLVHLNYYLVAQLEQKMTYHPIESFTQFILKLHQVSGLIILIVLV